MGERKIDDNAIPGVVRVDGKVRSRENRYYLKVADRYRAVGFIILFILVLFGGVMLMNYGEYITYDNFVYLLRDFDGGVDSDAQTYDDIVYTAEERMSFCTYRGALVTVGNRSVTIRDLSGAVLAEGTESFSNPASDTSGKYLLAYDVGCTSYSLYNLSTRIIQRTTDGALIAASVSDGGEYAVTFESDSSRYVTELYSSAFKRKMSIYTDKYVIDSEICRNGKMVATASMSEAGSGLECEVLLYAFGSEKAAATLTYSGELPLELASVGDDDFILLTDVALRFISKDGEVLQEVYFDGNISYFDVSDGGAIALLREGDVGNVSRVYTFDNEGNILYNNLIDIRVSGAAVSSDDRFAGYIMTSDGVTALLKNGEIIEEKTSGEALRILESDGGVLVCTASSAHRVKFSSDADSATDN